MSRAYYLADSVGGAALAASALCRSTLSHSDKGRLEVTTENRNAPQINSKFRVVASPSERYLSGVIGLENQP